jgi:tetratricopeptide (TPR) repeat protein/transcriptional regulator with XRE-family HTH domain
MSRVGRLPPLSMRAIEDWVKLMGKAETSFGGLLRQFRLAADLSQEELAERSGMASRTISNMECGRTARPYRASVASLANALGLPLAEREQLCLASRRIAGPGLVAVGEPAGTAAIGARWPDRSVQSGQGAPGRPRLEILPRQLPSGTNRFVGREAELATLGGWLDDALSMNGTVFIIAMAGTPGVGKTTLAIHWARSVARHFPDGQLYVNLQGFDPTGLRAMTEAEAIWGFLDALQVPLGQVPPTIEAQAGMYRSLIADRRMLLVLDNARDAEQVRHLLPGSPGCLVVVTSRNQLTGLVVAQGARTLNLEVFTPADARSLLECGLGNDRVAAEPEAASQVIERCGRLPLALSIVAARAELSPALPLAELAAQLHDANSRLDLLEGSDTASSLRATLSSSYLQLPPAASTMFRLLSLHPGPDVSAAAVASLAGLSQAQAGRALRQLTVAHLLSESLPGRYTFHDLIRIYAYEQIRTGETAAELQTARHRLLDHYLHSAHDAMLLVSGLPHPLAMAPPGPGVSPEEVTSIEQARAWFEAEKHVLLAAVAQAYDSAFPGHAWRIAAALGTFFSRAGRSQQSIDVLSTALTAVKATDDHFGLAHIHVRLGRAQLGLRSFVNAEANLCQALGEFKALGDVTGQGISHQYLSLAFEGLGNYREALRHSQTALDMFRDAGDQLGQAGTLNAIGWLNMRLQDYAQGLKFCQEALDLNTKAGFRSAEAETWDSMGYAHHHLGHYAQAHTCYQKALSLHRQVGKHHYVADTLIHIGDTHQSARNMRAARDSWQQALVILQELEHPDAEAVQARLRLAATAR